jgi:hypothetical protein
LVFVIWIIRIERIAAECVTGRKKKDNRQKTKKGTMAVWHCGTPALSTKGTQVLFRIED